MKRKTVYLLLAMLICFAGYAQMGDHVFKQNIHSVKLHTAGNQLGYPVIRLNGGDQLELHFDDLDADVKYYSYTFVLCNADWTPLFSRSLITCVVFPMCGLIPTATHPLHLPATHIIWPCCPTVIPHLPAVEMIF